MKISFTDIDVSSDGWLRCNVTRETTEEFYIQLPYSYTPAPDVIATSYAMLCGREFDEVTIDLPLGPQQVKTFEESLRAKINHTPGRDVRRRQGVGNGLNFSGGFDSLAAMSILDDPHLISLDFGGSLAREREFFERFDPYIFSTNLIKLRLHRYSWQFMGLGSILLRDELQLGSYSFGSIMAGALPRLLTRSLNQGTSGIPVANALGMKRTNPVAGISEIAAIRIVAMNHPNLLMDALMSVAAPHEGKFQRKYQMLEAVISHLGLPMKMPMVPDRIANVVWGSSFAADLASLFVIQELGAEYIAPTFENGIPENVIEGMKNIDLSFMQRFNPQAYEGVDLHVLADLQSRMVKHGITPFWRKDWEEATKVVRLLRD